MKILFYGGILSLFIIFGCTDDDQIPNCIDCAFTCLADDETDVVTNDCIDNWECNSTVSPNSKVDVSQREGISGGTKNVFQLINDTQGSAVLADDEFTNILVFELDDSQSSFSVEGSELSLLNAHFNRICYCSDVGFRAVTTGCIQGERRENIWYVQGNLIIGFDFGGIEFKFDVTIDS